MKGIGNTTVIHAYGRLYGANDINHPYFVAMPVAMRDKVAIITRLAKTNKIASGPFFRIAAKPPVKTSSRHLIDEKAFFKTQD